MAAILLKMATALSVSPLVISQLADSNTNLMVLELLYIKHNSTKE